MLQLPGKVNLDNDVWEQVTQALPAIAGAGLIGASLAAIPTVISFATVTYVPRWSGTVYVAFVIDVYARPSPWASDQCRHHGSTSVGVPQLR